MACKLNLSKEAKTSIAKFSLLPHSNSGYVLVCIFNKWIYCVLTLYMVLFSTIIYAKIDRVHIATESDSVARNIDSYVHAITPKKRSANDLGWACIASSSLVSSGVIGAQAKLKEISNKLFNGVVRDVYDNPIGWGSGTIYTTRCNPSDCDLLPKTVYGFQTGLAVACLAKAGSLLSNSEYTNVANKVMTYWKGLRRKDTPCVKCTYFYASNSPKDADRYVRNMNLFMAFGAEELGVATNNHELRSMARSAVQSDIVERSLGNRGYLGMQDPLWSQRANESERIENHAGSMAVLLKSMGNSMRDAAVSQHAMTVWQDWATCTNDRCVKSGCKYWAGDAQSCLTTATASHCAFRNDMQPLAESQCKLYVENKKSLSGFALWAWKLGMQQ